MGAQNRKMGPTLRPQIEVLVGRIAAPSWFRELIPMPQYGPVDLASRFGQSTWPVDLANGSSMVGS